MQCRPARSQRVRYRGFVLMCRSLLLFRSTRQFLFSQTFAIIIATCCYSGSCRLELVEAIAEVGLSRGESVQIASTWDNAVPRRSFHSYSGICFFCIMLRCPGRDCKERTSYRKNWRTAGRLKRLAGESDQLSVPCRFNVLSN